ncbi:hypothetical protein SCOR_04530 [Sulfidibacter corallicola]|uniref:Uncharacterized protein n=1 Tax=Sulfidibacter corallicola TaxID=2818388 RepID=A0A8A4TPR4_SULCO|nr:hypothetical protein [Sulfidibacter corallicola]QTD51959.1 hypothetical protein J3U87_05755 [Sulfidibacter corallicola]
MLVNNMSTDFRAKLLQVVDDYIATELESIRNKLIGALLDTRLVLNDFAELALRHLCQRLKVDRIYACDTRDGQVLAGWNKGKNIARVEDWDEGYVPLEMDETLKLALEGDELVANPVPGVGADFTMPVYFDDGRVWLLVFDQTDEAREFNNRDIAHMYLVRDLIRIKARWVNEREPVSQG